MKASLFICFFMFAGSLTAAAAWGNPALLPQHPGYPMSKAIDPVTGQSSLANDPGQSNAGGESALSKASALSDRNLSQQLSSDDLDKRHLENSGAAQSKGQDPIMDQPTKESTKVHPSPQ
ncbi:MAG: hypothetical protein M3M98_08205 [Nitrospirota bacterium]|nr:hypothetical protein [Nitrospirota bacterium]